MTGELLQKPPEIYKNEKQAQCWRPVPQLVAWLPLCLKPNTTVGVNGKTYEARKSPLIPQESQELSCFPHHKKYTPQPGRAASVCNPETWEAETEELCF